MSIITVYANIAKCVIIVMIKWECQ